MRHPFLERLERGPVLCDGAMGTLLYSRGVPYQRCFDELNLSAPDLVQEIHREYILAGAEVIETNTFGANRVKLAAHGLERKVRDINFRGVKIAREAMYVSGEPVFLAGAVGPLGQPLAPIGSISASEARAIFKEQIEALLEAGADLIILETFNDLDELRQAVLAAQETCDLPVIAQMSFAEDGLTTRGDGPLAMARAMAELGVEIIGANCGVGPQVVLDVLEQVRRELGLKLSAMPNAGVPQRVEGRFVYFSTPEYFAEYTIRFIRAGVSIIGGCCGTTPRHIAAMKQAVDSLRSSSQRTTVSATADHQKPAVSSGERGTKDKAEPPTFSLTPLGRKLAEGQFVVSVELDPPKGLNPTRVLQGAEMLRQVGVDCINIGDSPMARVRMSCIAMAQLIEQQVGLETIIHFTTRDRNLMALQSELLGAHALGIRNVLALTGDPPAAGNYPHATGVWDVDSIGLIRILKQMNQGLDWAGNSIGRPTSFLVACAVNPVAEDLDLEIDRFWKKVEAGADFAMSQPLYDVEQLLSFLERLGGKCPIPLVLGVMPLQSYKHAEFLHNELPGVTIPLAVRERMRRAGERGLEEGIAQAQEFMAEAQQYVQGVYLMPSFGRYEVVAELVKVLTRWRTGASV